MKDECFLIRSVCEGDRNAARALFDRYREQVRRVVYQLVFDLEETRDICQETWMKAFSGLRTFKGGSSFETWLLRIAVNTAISAARKEKSRGLRRTGSIDEIAQIAPETPPGQRTHLEEAMQQEAIERSLSLLSPQQRQAFVLHHCEGMPIAEIAEVMGCREGTVKSHLFRAVRRLRDLLRPLLDLEEVRDETSDR